MSWKEQLKQAREKDCVAFTDGGVPVYKWDKVQEFISTEIIEKLIADTELLIAEDWASEKYPIEECLMMSETVVKQLRDKWL